MPNPGQNFTDLLSRRSEHIADEILKDILPFQTFVGSIETGLWPAFSGVSRTTRRFNNVYPNLSGGWETLTESGCTVLPCDPTERKIGMGYTESTATLKRASFATDIMCFDRIVTADDAVEQWAHILNNLRLATNIIMSDRYKMLALELAGRSWVASATCPTFTHTWDTDEQILTVDNLPTSQITPEMLMRRYTYQTLKGALGAYPAGSRAMIQYITDADTLWNLQQGNATLQTQWQFMNFDAAAEEFYKYGWTGKLGNFAIKVDLMPMRFEKVDDTHLQKVLPFENGAAGGEGIASDVRPEYLTAPYQLDFIWHPRGFKVLTLDMRPVNPAMPYVTRNLGGEWQFVMDNITTTDESGNLLPVDNSRRNKGKFIADFVLAGEPNYTEFLEAVLVLREQPVITIKTNTAEDPGNYDSTDWDSGNDPCPNVLYFTPELDGDGDSYDIAANTITCNGVPIVHTAVSSATLAQLIIDLNAATTPASLIGVWSVEGSTQIKLTGSTCEDVDITWVD